MEGQSISSDEKNANAVIAKGKNYLRGATLLTDGSNTATLIVYDNTTTSGTILHKVVVVAPADRNNVTLFEYPVKAETGLSAAVTGTGATYIVYYG